MLDPTKRTSAKVIITTEEDQILVVKDHWKSHWSFPGGVIEVGESPTAAAIREVKEETSLDVSETVLRFLGVQYRGDDGRDTLQVMFHAALSAAYISTTFHAADGEGEAWKLLGIIEAKQLLEGPTAASLEAFLSARSTGAVLMEYC